MVVLIEVLLFCLFGLLPAFFDDLDVVVEDGSDDGDHISLDDPSPYALSAANSYVDDTLKGEIPLPHIHHVLAPSLLQYANKPLNTSIHCEDVPNPSRGGRKICQMIQ